MTIRPAGVWEKSRLIEGRRGSNLLSERCDRVMFCVGRTIAAANNDFPPMVNVQVCIDRELESDRIGASWVMGTDELEISRGEEIQPRIEELRRYGGIAVLRFGL